MTVLVPALLAPSARGAEEVRLRHDWRFARFGPLPEGGTLDEPAGVEKPNYDYSAWRSVGLPHDWGIEGPFRADLPNNTGKLPWAGIGWYRRTLPIPESDAGKRLWLRFDGAMSHAQVFVNGLKAGEWAYGYSSFHVDITDFVKPGTRNELAVRLENPSESSRWYPGGGLYRDVWLCKSDPVHLAPWGVFVHTASVGPEAAEVQVETTIQNQSSRITPVRISHVIFSPSGKEIARRENTLSELSPGADGQMQVKVVVTRPELWDVDSPSLYRVHTVVVVGDREVDRMETIFGIRTLAWTAAEGFRLNGRVLRLQGVCNHHDLGPLGAAFNLRAAERQLELLREMGCNAIRTAHNPPAPGLLDLCDRMGFLVIDEMFDCWQLGKLKNDYSLDYDRWHERDVINLVRRDRNHPCVILWSIGNEVREQVDQNGNHNRARRLSALFHREDPTRQTTVGMNQPRSLTNGFAQTVDIAGYNYKAIQAKTENYLTHIKQAPAQPFFGAETASTVSSRDEYYFPVNPDKAGGFYRFQVSSYDLYAPPWANIPDMDFDSADRLPGLGGEFVWTGFDYLGEPTPYNKDETNLLNLTNSTEKQRMEEEMRRLGGHVPSRSSYFGILDLAGFPKDRYFLYQSRWRPELPMAHLLPHWTWPEREGESTPVHLYTSGDEAELFLNGRSLGRKKKAPGEYRLRWDDVCYEPGELRAVAYRGGQSWATTVRRTTGTPVELRLQSDRSELRADGDDLAFVTVSLRDARGDVVPHAGAELEFTLSGPGEIIGVDNGDATNLSPMQATRTRAFHGLALVVVRTQADRAGEIKLTAASPQLPTATCSLHSTALRSALAIR